MNQQEILDHLLEVESIVKERTKHPLNEPEAFIEWQGIKLLAPGSILTIQGKSGSHKSRLTAEIAITLLSDQKECPNALGIRKAMNESILVVGIDTERDTKFQFPLALRRIIEESGNENIDKQFRFTSLIHLSRQLRRLAAREYIKYIRSGYEGNLCIIIDVVSDISQDFNSVAETGEVLDQLKLWLNEYNCALIVVLHENPGSEKMRGHLGTELLNKATDSVSIKLDYDDQIEIKFIKTRNYKRPGILTAFLNESNGRLEKSFEGYTVSGRRMQSEFESLLVKLFTEKSEYSKKEIVEAAKAELGRKKDSIEDYIKEVKRLNINGIDYKLIRNQDGKEAVYKIQKIESAVAAFG